MAVLADLFAMARDTPSDINEHCRTLRELAEQCEHVTEFGMRGGVSTVALLAGSITGKLKRLVSYDTVPTHAAKQLRAVAPDVFRFVHASSLTATIEETDLLFIDTLHTEAQLLGELTRHHTRVRRWIAMHDTVLYGENGEDGGPGLLPALVKFLESNPDWITWKHYPNNNGLTVLAKAKG